MLYIIALFVMFVLVSAFYKYAEIQSNVAMQNRQMERDALALKSKN